MKVKMSVVIMGTMVVEVPDDQRQKIAEDCPQDIDDLPAEVADGLWDVLNGDDNWISTFEVNQVLSVEARKEASRG